MGILRSRSSQESGNESRTGGPNVETLGKIQLLLSGLEYNLTLLPTYLLVVRRE